MPIALSEIESALNGVPMDAFFIAVTAEYLLRWSTIDGLALSGIRVKQPVNDDICAGAAVSNLLVE